MAVATPAQHENRDGSNLRQGAAIVGRATFTYLNEMTWGDIADVLRHGGRQHRNNHASLRSRLKFIRSGTGSLKNVTQRHPMSSVHGRRPCGSFPLLLYRGSFAVQRSQ